MTEQYIQTHRRNVPLVLSATRVLDEDDTGIRYLIATIEVLRPWWRPNTAEVIIEDSDIDGFFSCQGFGKLTRQLDLNLLNSIDSFIESTDAKDTTSWSSLSFPHSQIRASSPLQVTVASQIITPPQNKEEDGVWWIYTPNGPKALVEIAFSLWKGNLRLDVALFTDYWKSGPFLGRTLQSFVELENLGWKSEKARKSVE